MKRIKGIYNMRIILTLDVGGTTIDGALVTEDRRVVGELKRVASTEGDSADIIIEHFRSILAGLQQDAQNGNFTPVGVGIGMPGPFDYEEGVSRMEHKFRALLGKNIKKPLEEALALPVFFINDAAAFALGCWWVEHSKENRLLAITLGTGLGSGFVVDGEVVSKGRGVPTDGEIWNFPYRDGILEDVVSRRGIEGAYADAGGAADAGVREIAELVLQGNAAAAEAFRRFADDLGRGLALVAGGFHPTHVAFGGQIAKAFNLFGDRAALAFAAEAGETIPFSATKNVHLPLLGAARYALEQLDA